MRMMTTIRRVAAWTGLCVALLMALAACDRGATEPAPEELRFAEIVFEKADGTLVYSHADHWHGFLDVKNGETLDVRVFFVADPRPAGEHGAPAREQWFTLQDYADHRLRVTLNDPTLAAWTGDRHAATLAGRFPGTTEIGFVVLRGSTTVYQAPPTSLVVRP
jgi:hypothetical protein